MATALSSILVFMKSASATVIIHTVRAVIQISTTMAVIPGYLTNSNDYNWQELANWLLPGWFNTTVNILGANIAVMVICCVFLIVCSCFALANRYTPKSTVKKDRAAVALLYTSLFLLVLSSLLNVSGIAIFSCNGPRRDYMPMSYRNHFGFSFWIDLAVCVLLGGCSFTVFLAAIGKTIHMQGPDDPRYSEDMMLGRI
jgi:hypothetical protein